MSVITFHARVFSLTVQKSQEVIITAEEKGNNTKCMQAVSILFLPFTKS
jgi:hypothetical protein